MIHPMNPGLIPWTDFHNSHSSTVSRSQGMNHRQPADETHMSPSCVASPFSRYDQDCNDKKSQPKIDESSSTSPPIQFHSRHELALAEKCIKKLVVDSRFFPARAAENDWFRGSHCTAVDNDEEMTVPYEASTSVTALYEHELSVGRLLGTGGFCQVRVVRLLHNDDNASTDQQQEEDENPQQHKYAIKYLCPNIKQKSRKAFSRGAADLAIEARFLSLLSHENIITLHHVSAGSLREAYNCSEDDVFHDINEKNLRNYGYFLILDYLTGTLDGRIEKTYIPQVTTYLGEHPNKHHDHHRCDTRHHPHKHGGQKMQQQHNHQLPQPHWWHLSAWHHEHSPKGKDSNMQPLRKLLAQRLTIIKSIASALQYLHENNIIMRDVKPNNIGFYNNGQEEVPKLFDFGLVKEMKPSNRTSYVHDCPVSKIVSILNDYPVYKLTGRTGSRRYMSPEVAFSRPYNEKADVYSFGILLYEVSTLLQPFQGWTLDTHEEQVLKRHHRPCLVGYTHWPDDLFSLISDCWEGDMWHRPDMSEVVQRLYVCISALDASTVEGRMKASLINVDSESTSPNDPKCCCPLPNDGHKNKHKNFKHYLSTAASVFPDIASMKPESPFHSTGRKPHTQAQ
jgi:serine/threonine protein kinase